MNHTISCQIISQNPNSVNWIGGFYFEPDQSFNYVFDRFPEVHSPPLGLSLIEVELVSTTPDIAKTGTSENPSHLIEIVSQRLSQTEVTTLVDGRYLDHDTLS